MRKLVALVAVLACSVAAAAGILLDQTSIVTFTDCPANGLPTAQALSEGTYLMTVADESTWLCTAASSATCGSGGTKYGAPFAMLFAVPRGGWSVACRSTSAGGDIQFTRTGN